MKAFTNKSSWWGIAILAMGINVVGCSGGDDDDGDGTLRDTNGVCGSALNWDVWVPRQAANDLRIVNGPTLNETMQVDFSGTGLVGPHNVVFSPDGTKAAFAMLGTPDLMYADGGVVIMNAVNATIESTIVTNAKTHGVTFTPDGSKVWGINVNDDSVSVIDVATATVTDKFTVGGTGGALVARFNANGSKAYVTGKGVVDGRSSLSRINVSDLSIDGHYSTGEVTTEEAMDADGKYLYVTNGGANSVDRIDLSLPIGPDAVTEWATGIGGSHSVVIAKKSILVTARSDGSVNFMDADGNLLTKLDIPTAMGNSQPDILALSPDCSRAYAAEKTGGVLHEINVNDRTLKGMVDLGGGTPHGVAVRETPSDM